MPRKPRSGSSQKYVTAVLGDTLSFVLHRYFHKYNVYQHIHAYIYASKANNLWKSYDI